MTETHIVVPGNPARPTDFNSLADMQAWAKEKILAKPDFIIGDNYMRRWWIVPRNEYQNVYLHHMLHSDNDEAMHDHPWNNVSFIIMGGYLEHTPDGVFERKEGDIIHRRGEDSHWLELHPGESCVSLFLTGPIYRRWGFHCPKGWVHWKDYVANSESQSLIGHGCGEH